jgi:hypothetical protein
MTWAKTSVQAPRPSKQEKEHKEPHNLMLRSLFGSNCNCNCNQCVPSHYATPRHCNRNHHASDLEVKDGEGASTSCPQPDLQKIPAAVTAGQRRTPPFESGTVYPCTRRGSVHFSLPSLSSVATQVNSTTKMSPKPVTLYAEWLNILQNFQCTSSWSCGDD